jgi:hypothetical protein
MPDYLLFMMMVMFMIAGMMIMVMRNLIEFLEHILDQAIHLFLLIPTDHHDTDLLA